MERNMQNATANFSLGCFLKEGLSINLQNIEVDMAMQLLSQGYGYDTVMAVTGWSQYQSDVFQDNIAWDKQQGIRFDWLPESPCRIMDFNSAEWIERWFRVVVTKISEVQSYRKNFEKTHCI